MGSQIPRATASGSEAESDAELVQLMRRLAEVPDGTARFTEERTLALLEIPLRTEGELIYRAPDYLERRVEGPRTERYVIVGDLLSLEDRDGRREIRLDSHPALQAFADTYRGTLAGDLAALRQYYAVHLNQDEGGWHLRLSPTDPELRGAIDHVDVHGLGAELSRIEIHEPNGDTTVTKIAPRDD